MTFNRARAAAYMKERWEDPDKIQLALYHDSPFYGLIEKDDAMGGYEMRLPLMNVRAQGRSATYARAVANATGSDLKRFAVTYKNNFQIGKIEGDTLRDMNGNENALFDALDLEMESVLTNLKADMGFKTWGDAGGSRGRVGTIGAGLAGANCRITLSNVADSRKFEIGMLLQASANDGTASGHALRDSGDRITITGINRALGYLEFASDVTATITGLVANDYLFADGDFKECITGVAGWIPSADPSSGDSFFGVDRSANVQTLSGVRQSITGMSLEDGLVHGLAVMGHHGAFPKHIFVNPIRWGQLARSIGARGDRFREVKNDEARVSYKSMTIVGPSGDVDVLSDGGVGVNDAFALTLNTWKYGFVGKVVGLVDEDGLTIRRGTNDDWAFEVLSRGNIGCTAPGKNGRFTLAAMTI